MSARITADEAKALLTGITPGRWTTCLRADLCVVVDDGTEEGGDGDPVAEILITDERPSRNQMADALLLAAAPDLAETVVQLSADLHRVTMEIHAARHLAEEGQRARVKQSMELAKALARIAELEALAAGPRAEVVIGADGQPLRFMHGGQAHHVELDASGRPVRMVDLRAGIAPQNVDANGAPVNAEHGR